MTINLDNNQNLNIPLISDYLTKIQRTFTYHLLVRRPAGQCVPMASAEYYIEQRKYGMDHLKWIVFSKIEY